MKRHLRFGTNVIYNGDVYRINSTASSEGVKLIALNNASSIIAKKRDIIPTPHDKNDLIKYNKNYYIIKNSIFKNGQLHYELEFPNKFYKTNNTNITILAIDPDIKAIPNHLQEKFSTFLKFIDRYNTSINYLNKKRDTFVNISYDNIETIMNDLIVKCKLTMNQLSKIEYTLKKTLNPSFQLHCIITSPFDFITQDHQLISYDRADKIAKEFNLEVDFRVKCEKWTYCLFNEEKTFYIRTFKYNEKIKQFCSDKNEDNDYDKYLEYLNKDVVMDIVIDGKEYKTTQYLLDLEHSMTDMTMDLFYDKSYDIPKDDIISEIHNFELERQKVLNKKTYALEPEQKESVIKSIQNKLSIITGYPGTGKTEIVCCITYVLNKFYKKYCIPIAVHCDTGNIDPNNPFSAYTFTEGTDTEMDTDSENMDLEKYVDPKTIGLIAPTGLAGLNLQKSIVKSHYNEQISGTCHKIIYNIFQNIKHHKDNCSCKDKTNCKYNLQCKLFIIDESSMVDNFMFYEILKMCEYFDSRLIIIGDVNQLPSVGPGVVLKNLIDTSCFDITKLTNIKRQHVGSLVNCIKKMNTGIIRETEFEDGTMSIVNIRDFIHGDKINRDVLLKLIRENNIDQHNTRFITYFRSEKYLFNTNGINNLLQDIYNPNGSIIPSNNKFENGLIFKISDKIIRTENDYSSEQMRANGEQAKITDFDGKLVTIIYDDGKDKPETIGINELYENFRLNYCTTIHSAQGSQYENVVFFIQPGQSYIIDKTSVYTGISRAKNKCIVVAKKDDFIKCQENIKNSDSKVSLFMRQSNNYEL